MQAVPGLTPGGCDRLTLSEIDFVLTRAADQNSKGPTGPSDAEILAHAAWWQSLTPKERLLYGER